MNEMTKQEFFDKLDWEGSLSDMVSWGGNINITDDPDLNEIYNSLVNLVTEFDIIYDEWKMAQQDEGE